MSQYVVDGNVQMVGYEVLTISNSAIGFTEAKYSKTGKTANTAVVNFNGPIRYTLDNTNTDLVLSDTVGMYWDSSSGDLVIPMEDLSKVRFIRVDSTDVEAHCLYILR